MIVSSKMKYDFRPEILDTGKRPSIAQISFYDMNVVPTVAEPFVLHNIAIANCNGDFRTKL